MRYIIESDDNWSFGDDLFQKAEMIYTAIKHRYEIDQNHINNVQLKTNEGKVLLRRFAREFKTQTTK